MEAFHRIEGISLNKEINIWKEQQPVTEEGSTTWKNQCVKFPFLWAWAFFFATVEVKILNTSKTHKFGDMHI